jgi:biopolymer transport protein ExbB
MRRYWLAAAVGAALAINVGVAQQPAQSLDELLRNVQQGTARDSAEHQARLTEFRNNQAEQARLLQQARNDRAAQEARSEALETQFDENQLLIADVRMQLDERLGSLRELFGVLQQVSGDARSTFQESLTNVEYPERAQFLTDLAAKMGETTVLPTIEEIERIWFELQREATELGKVKRIPSQTFSNTSGDPLTEPVVRVGPFNLVADGRYLQYEFGDDGVGRVSELQRQPAEARFLNSTSNLINASADEDFVRFGIDITRGQVLGLLIAQPSFMEQVQQGRTVGYVTIALGIFGVLLALERLITLGIVGGKVNRQLKSETSNPNNPLGRVLSVYDKNRNADTETLELKLGEAILKEMPPLQRGILFIKIISVVAPLLGLLGTVTGMIETFQAMALFGTGDASVMAGGISQALVTTVIGLCVAIPTVLLHTFVSGRSRRIVQILQEQSAGIVAAHAERGH